MNSHKIINIIFNISQVVPISTHDMFQCKNKKYPKLLSQIWPYLELCEAKQVLWNLFITPFNTAWFWMSDGLKVGQKNIEPKQKYIDYIEK